MRRADIVIGAQYGDEGKGLLTDRLVAEAGPGSLVVRFNGGAQAGHTVQDPSGLRHVHSHLGSGAFLGAPTLLSRFFVANPILHATEAAVMAAKGVRPVTYLDAKAPVTTPYDMMLNRAVEEARGAARHGSVGAGFGETLERGLDPRLALLAADLSDPAKVASVLQLIRTEWVPARAARLGLDVGSLPDYATDARLSERFVEDVARFLSRVEVVDADFLRGWRGPVVFEGAQGLLLDQDRGAFPHVTRSNTGLRNALSLAMESGIQRLDAVYATRAYVTRHGAGPLSHETDGRPYAGIVDATNVPNPWQGTLRFGWLDPAAFADAVCADLRDAEGSGIEVRHRVAVTCLDQVPEGVTVAGGRGLETVEAASLPCLLANASGAEGALGSWGPTRDDVVEGGACPRSRPLILAAA